ncbi:MAG TPA: hypothetical protein VF170_20385, partial [Planctomycetaceae bacterium]
MAATVLAGRASLAEGFSPLFRYVPEGANAALFIDADALQKTPFAKEQGWFEKRGDSGRPLYIPSEAQRIIVASRVDPAGRLAPQWEVALLRLSSPVDAAAAARAEGGYVDQLAGREVVWTPSEAYLIPFEPQTLGQYSPGDRQAAARWVTAVAPPARPTGGLTDYLKTASASAGPKAPVVMAFDLADAFPPHDMRSAVMSSQDLKVDDARRKAIADALVSIKGVTILLEVDDAAHATARFDFGGKVDAFRGLEKEILTAVLEAAGAALPNADGWHVHSVGNAVTARGDMTSSGLRRLLSLIEVPTTKFSSLADAKPAPDEKQVAAEASRQYFRTVTSLLDDLRESLGDTKGNEALYMERYAKKIDRLPILNVDDELLAWGGSVAETLRGGSLSVRGAGLRTGVRQASMYGAYQYSYDGYGYYGAQTTESARSQAFREETAVARSQVFGSAKELADATARVRV